MSKLLHSRRSSLEAARCRACASRSAATVGKPRNFQTESLPKKAHFFFVLFVVLIVPCVVRSLKEFSSGISELSYCDACRRVWVSCRRHPSRSHRNRRKESECFAA